MISMLIGGFLIVFGLVGLAIIVVIYFILEQFVPVDLPTWSFLLFGVVSLLEIVIGIVLLVVGRSKKKVKEELALQIYNQGLPAKARVTFVDKDYSFLVNEKPIYSVVEFVFTDHMGRQHTARKQQVESDLVIRSSITVGSEVDIKYMSADPNKNVLMIKDPSAPAV